MIENNFIWAQVFGLLAFFVSILSVLQKDRSKYIYYNLSQNVFSCIQYFLLDKMIATYLSIISVIRLIIYRFKEKYHIILYVIILIFFVSINIIISILTFEKWYDIFPMIASTLVCFSVWQNNVVLIKIILIITKFLWGIYAVITQAYFSIAMDIFMIIWTIIYLIKERKKLKHN